MPSIESTKDVGSFRDYPSDNMKKYLTTIIIVAVCALVLGPLFAGFLGPDWRARWMLAWAANAYQNGHPEEAEETLNRASELSSQLATDSEFWKLKFDFVFNKEKTSSEAVSKLFEESLTQISRAPEYHHAAIASFVGQLFHLHRKNDLAVAVLEKFYPPISKRDAAENNTIAYFRSLTGKGLETALVEIDAALVADGTSREEYLDTKAWVLHGLRKDDVALPFIEEAVKRLYSHIQRYNGVRMADRVEFHAWLYSEVVAKTDATESADEGAVEKIINKASAPNRLDELKLRFPYINPDELDDLARKTAALRFHRACILDELGRNEESDLDYVWLDCFGFTETENLN